MLAMNFQAAEQRHFRVLRSALVCLVVAAALSLVGAFMLSERYERNLARTNQEVSELRSELAASQLGEADLEQLAEQANTIRRVVAHLGAPLPDVLASVADSVPANVRLELLEYDAREGAGTVRAVSPDSHSLADFARSLEASPPVRRAVVARQETIPGPEQGYRHDIHLVGEP